jgi:hypothetical protein
MTIPKLILESISRMEESPEVELFFWKWVPYRKNPRSEYVTYSRDVRPAQPWEPMTAVSESTSVNATVDGFYNGKPFHAGWNEKERVAVLWFEHETGKD